MALTSGIMDERADVCEDGGSEPDALTEWGDSVIAVGAVLIENGDLRVDPLDLF